MFGFKRDKAGGRLGRLRSYRIYYGPASDEARSRLLEADLAILEPRQWRPDEIAGLRHAGVDVLGYWAIMESADWDERRMSERSPKDVLTRPDGEPIRFSQWNSVLMDLRSDRYRASLLRELDDMAAKYPLSGVFLDTVGDIDDYVPEALRPAMRESYRSMLAVAAGRYPYLKLLQNRGFSLLNDCHGLIDGVLWEGFDAGSLSTPWSKELINELTTFRKKGLTVLSSTEEVSPRHRKAAQRLGFVHWTSPAGDYMKL